MKILVSGFLEKRDYITYFRKVVIAGEIKLVTRIPI